MCTVTLIYDGNNVMAQQKLAALLATGLFLQSTDNQIESDDLNERDAALLEDFMQQVRTRIPSRNMSLEEAYNVVMGELKPLYGK